MFPQRCALPVRSHCSFPLPERSPMLLLRASYFVISFAFSSMPGTLQICQQEKVHHSHITVLADHIHTDILVPQEDLVVWSSMQ